MSNLSGSFTLPTPQRTSQLVNDTRFSSIREYILNSSSLSGSSQLNISDLIVGSVIYRIDLIVLSAFSNINGDQHSIKVQHSNGTILMSDSWNDPNTIGTYVTDCYSTIQTGDSINIIHSLSNMTAGSAILRLYIYTNIDATNKLLTSDGLYYRTVDNNGILVP